jgi:CRISPR-associated endonuclease Csn1
MKGCVLGIDVGVASVGAALIEVDDVKGTLHYRGIIDGVSHIFPAADGAAERRLQRSIRKRYQRQTHRLKDLRGSLSRLFSVPPGFDDVLPDAGQAYIAACKAAGEPAILSANSRFRLRAFGLEQQLTPGDLARTILHVAKNRGMRLTRVLENGKDDKGEKQARAEASGMAQEAEETRSLMVDSKATTPGSFLWQREQDATKGNQRPALRNRKGRDGGFLFTRQQVEAEFDMLLAKQAEFYPDILTVDVMEALRTQVFWEKDAPEPEIGPCLYFPDREKRLPEASDLFQCKRIYEQVNSLLVKFSNESKERLTPDQRDLLIAELMTGEDLGGTKIKKILKLEKGLTLSLDAGYGKRKEAVKIKGHRLAYEFAKVPELQAVYADLPPERRESLVELLRKERDREIVVRSLCDDFGLSHMAAGYAVEEVILPAGYAATGPTATRLLFETLRDEVMEDGQNAGRVMFPYDAEQWLDQKQGFQKAGAQVVAASRLPYYGRVFPHLVRGRMKPEDRGYPAATNEEKFGRIPNPVVHVALNRIRKVVNTLLARHEKTHGLPLRVHVELAREMSMSEEERDAYARQTAKQHKQNSEDDRVIVKNGGIAGRKARRMLRLAREQGWKCPYSLKQIDASRLFKDFDLDHILPRSQTLDDSLGNLVVAWRDANRVKGQKHPHKAFGDGKDYKREDGVLISHEQMIENIRNTKGMAHKAWRFGPDAMERYADDNDFTERFLNDTRYIAKWVAQYLQCITRPDSRRKTKPVVALNGRVVGDLRYGWGLKDMVEQIALDQEPDGYKADAKQGTGKKNRDDHRHHLLDAIVAALTPPRLVQILKNEAKRQAEANNGRIRQLTPPPPWEHFAQDIRLFLAESRANHKPDRNINAGLHEATCLGVVARLGDGSYLVRNRKRLVPGMVVDPKKLEDAICLPERYINALAKGLKEGSAHVFWPSRDPVGDLKRIATDLKEVHQAIMALYEQQPETETVMRDTGEPDASTQTRVIKPEERLGRAIACYVDQTGRRTVRVYGMSQAVIIAENDNGVPSRSYRAGNNAWLDLYRGADGKTAYEIVRNIDAMKPGFTPQWQEDPENTALLRLYQGDTVELTDKEGQRRICVFRENSDGDWSFQPVNLAVNVRDTPLRSRLRFSFNRLLQADPRLIVVDAAGQVVWRSPKRNW